MTAISEPMLFCSGSRGNLSKYLIARGLKPLGNISVDLECQRHPSVLVLSYSATQRHESLQSYQEDIKYYETLLASIISLRDHPRIVFISSQTVTLDSNSYYAQSKLCIESLISKSGLDYIILRPGFLFSDEDQIFVSSIARIAQFPLTLGTSDPLFTACRASDILNRVRRFALLQTHNCHVSKVEQIGLTLMSLADILNLQRRYRFRAGAPRLALRLLATALPKLQKIINPVSTISFPSIAVASYYD